MSKILVAALASGLLTTTADAALVTYRLDYSLDLKRYEYDGYRKDDAGNEHRITITTPAKPNSDRYGQVALALTFDTDLVDLTSRTLKGSYFDFALGDLYADGLGVVGSFHGYGIYGGLDFDLTFDADGAINDWTVSYTPQWHGSSAEHLWDTLSSSYTISFCCVPGVSQTGIWDDLTNPYPDLFPYYYAKTIEFASQPGRWTRTVEEAPAPVPLPAAAPLLLTGVVAAAGLRLRRRRR